MPYRVRFCAIAIVLSMATLVGAAAMQRAEARPPDLLDPISLTQQNTSSPEVKPMYSLAKAIAGEAPGGEKRQSRRGLDSRLQRLLLQIESHFQRPVIISSGCRSTYKNRRVGGARKSYHLRCMAADIKMAGVSEGTLLRFVSRLPGRGGVGTYCRNSIVHVDVGPRRNWIQGCGRYKKKARYRTAQRSKRR